MTDYKLVPVEPTAEMVDAATEAFHLSSSISSIVRAALAVAPVVQGEPVGYVRPHQLEALRSGKVCGITLEDKPDAHNRVTIPLYTTPQPATGKEPEPISRNLRAVHAMILSALDRDAADGKAVRGEMAAELRSALSEHHPAPNVPTFQLGDRVRKTKGSQWKGRVVGTYSTSLTPEGYAVESDTEKGSVQIYPVGALELVGAHCKGGE